MQELISDTNMELIVNGLGGFQNIVDICCCSTRLRITVNNPEIIDEITLKKTGAPLVLRRGNNIQVVYGPQVIELTPKIQRYLIDNSNR